MWNHAALTGCSVRSSVPHVQCDLFQQGEIESGIDRQPTDSCGNVVEDMLVMDPNIADISGL